jgi:transcriptional regulator with XRE-family HTH domain
MKPSELIKWRKRNGYSQIKLGKALGVSTITIYRWEKAMREIPSFLHLALRCLELEGGELMAKGKKKRKEVKR